LQNTLHHYLFGGTVVNIIRRKMNKAVIESYLRNLAGQVIGAIMIVMQTSGVSTPIDFGGSEWLLVANALWASLIPVILRWANKADPAFGAVAVAVTSSVSKKLSDSAKSASASTAKKKPAPKKSGTGGGGKPKQVQ
jgi:hypothetical protein